MRAIQGDVRRAMVEQALARAQGDRSKAARLLDVSRQALQQMAQAGEARKRSKLATSGRD